MTKLLGTMLGDVLKAHPDGVYYYLNGAWVRVEEIPEFLLRSMEVVLVKARALYKVVMESNAARDWAEVFGVFQNQVIGKNPKPACDFEFSAKHWAACAGKAVKFIPSRFTAGARGKALIDSFGAWYQTEMDRGKALVNFQDATLRLRMDGQVA